MKLPEGAVGGGGVGEWEGREELAGSRASGPQIKKWDKTQQEEKWGV